MLGSDCPLKDTVAEPPSFTGPSLASVAVGATLFTVIVNGLVSVPPLLSVMVKSTKYTPLSAYVWLPSNEPCTTSSILTPETSIVAAPCCSVKDRSSR